MKRKLLLLLVCLFGALGGVKADVSLPDGWTKITQMPADPQNYVFVIADNSQNLMLASGTGIENGSSNDALFYKTAVANPTEASNSEFLFCLDHVDGNYYYMRTFANLERYFLSPDGAEFKLYTNPDQTAPSEHHRFIFEYGGGVWTITNNDYLSWEGADAKHLGPWSDVVTADAELAANKKEDKQGTFQIYCTKKFSQIVTSLIVNPGFEESTWWTGWSGTSENNNTDNTTKRQKFVKGDSKDNWGFSNMFSRMTRSGGNSIDARNLSQTLSQLQAGTYIMTAVIRADVSSTFYATVGGSEKNITFTTSGSGDNSAYAKTLTFTVPSQGDVTIGFKHNGGSGVNGSETWVGIDNFTLTRYTIASGDYPSEAIVNPSFETGNLGGWTNNGMQRQGNSDFAKTGSYYCEAWEPNGTKSVTQTIADLPAGFYRLSADSKARLVTSANISACGYKKDIKIADEVHTYNLDFYYNGTSEFTIGFTGVGTGAATSWLCVDNFRLTYLGNNGNDYTPLIKQADCNTTSQEYWPGNGRTTATGEHYSGDENRVYFTFTSGEDRHQDVTFPATGKYLLKTAVRCKVANTIATMSVGTASATTNFASSKNCYVIGTDGNETTTVNSDGGNWVYNELYFDANAGDVKTITIQLTSKDNVGETDCGGMTLTYLGTEGTLVGMEVSAVAKAGTFVAPFDVVIPARTTAYTVKAAGNGYITLEEKAVAGETLAANTPVILYAEDGIASKISKQFYGTATGSENENGDGYLIGMYNSAGTIGANAQNYVMQYNSTAGKPEFRQVTSENFATTANRSYLKLNANSESRVVIKFDGEDPTAITAIEAAESESGLKDGKYLIDGKIVIVKNGVKYGANGQKLN